MTITVLGATGSSGRHIVEKLLAQGHPVRAVVRKARKAAALQAAGVEVVEFDLASPSHEMFVPVFASAETVINAAATGSMTKRQAELIDHKGVVAAVDAAAALGVKRWVQISMMGSGDPGRLPGYLRATGRAKDAADTHLTRSGMTWTVIRPPWLTDGAAQGRITVGDSVTEGSLSRADLAAVAIASLDVTTTHNRMFEVTGGGAPITDALHGLA
ncbi:SDR family oxidoreductase [Streptomyces sp. NPDC001678]|uniref:SDR family oxidoreductase n=1 Tax=Streptomyces sp. NPDC001678 TaxID=3364599 RepID=UPI0036C0921A